MLHLKTINFYIVRLAPKRAQLMENMATNTYSLVSILREVIVRLKGKDMFNERQANEGQLLYVENPNVTKRF